MKCRYLVVDTAAFVKNVSLWEYGEKLYSLQEVIEEIRDKQTKQRLEAMPVPVTMRDPQPHSIRFVNEFSKKTGDYASLSLADVKLLALTYELEVEARGGSEHLQSEPRKIITEGPAIKTSKTDSSDLEGFYNPSTKEDVESPQTDAVEPESVDLGTLSLSEKLQAANHNENDDNSKGETGDIDLLEKDEESDEEESNVDDNTSEDESDGEGWITPSNLKQHKIVNTTFASEEKYELQEDIQVACITADFSIQNVLMHIGLPVMGVDGKLIRHIKTFILRCHACFRTTSVMTKVFCPHCGNKTLKKVSVTVNPDGTQKIWVNTKKPINKRGTKYSLPAPKGGKHGRNPILVEDQRGAKRFSSKMSSKKVNPLHEDYDPDHMPFAVRDVYSRAAQLGYIGGKNYHHYYWEKKNPNEPQKRIGKKK